MEVATTGLDSRLEEFERRLSTTESVPPESSEEVARRKVELKFGKVPKFHDFRFRS